MPIIGNIIKGFIDLRETLVAEVPPEEAQRKVLHKLLEKAKATEFGKQYSFEDILQAEDPAVAFAAAIPYFDYDKMQTGWWHRIHEGISDVSWPGIPDYFALSSGTTGQSSKRIPVTGEMISAIREAGLAQVYALSNFNMPPEFFEKGILMLGSSTALKQVDDHQEGEISGISAGNIPAWFRGYYKPGEAIAEINDWDEKVGQIAENAKDWDIGAISGIPSWMELMLQKVIEHHKVSNIHEIWPNLQVYTTGGVAFGPYEKSFRALLAHPITVIDTYLASEGFIAFQNRPETDAMKLVTDGGIYFEFVPFKPEYIKQDGSIRPDAPSVDLSGVVADEEYILIISTVSGAWRYLIGDTIVFTDVARAEIKITGRTKFFLNVVGSQLSVNKMDDAIKHMEEAFSLKISEYTLSAKRLDGEFFHCWYLGTEDKVDDKKLAQELDAFLKKANKNYRVARSKALKGVRVTSISA